MSGAAQPGPAVRAPAAASSHLRRSEAALAAAQDLLSVPFPPPLIEVQSWAWASVVLKTAGQWAAAAGCWAAEEGSG